MNNTQINSTGSDIMYYDSPEQVIEMVKKEWQTFVEKKLAGLAKQKDSKRKEKEHIYKGFTQSLFNNLFLCAKNKVFEKSHVVEPLDKKLANKVFELNKKVQELKSVVAAKADSVPEKLNESLDEAQRGYEHKLEVMRKAIESKNNHVKFYDDELEKLKDILKQAADQFLRTENLASDVLNGAKEVSNEIEKMRRLRNDTDADRVISADPERANPEKCDQRVCVVNSALHILQKKRGITFVDEASHETFKNLYNANPEKKLKV